MKAQDVALKCCAALVMLLVLGLFVAMFVVGPPKEGYVCTQIAQNKTECIKK